MTIALALCIVAAVLLLAVYALGVSAWLTVGMAMSLLTDRPIPERIKYLAVRWPLVLLGVVK